jgi:hypothetical protein
VDWLETGGHNSFGSVATGSARPPSGASEFRTQLRLAGKALMGACLAAQGNPLSVVRASQMRREV